MDTRGLSYDPRYMRMCHVRNVRGRLEKVMSHTTWRCLRQTTEEELERLSGASPLSHDGVHGSK